MQLDTSTVEHCKDCGGKTVTGWTETGMSSHAVHHQTCPTLLEIRKRYE
jgi:hypothetical protein